MSNFEEQQFYFAAFSIQNSDFGGLNSKIQSPNHSNTQSLKNSNTQSLLHLPS